MKRKNILVTQSSMPSYEEYISEIKDCWDTHWLTNMGEKHQQLEERLQEYLKVKRASLFSNGHMALELAIQAFDLSGEVITTPFTFASTTHAIVRNGLQPVFCDIDAVTLTIDSSKIEELITDKTTAILPVHVYGNVCEVEAIEKIAKKHGLKVIYDAAHAMGVFFQGKGIGTYGDASIFSFHATKVFNTIEGGAVCSENDELYEKLYTLKNFGITSDGMVEGIGANAKMNEFEAAMGLCNLRYIEEYIEKRKKITERYGKNLKNVEGITLRTYQENVKTNYAYFPVLVDQKTYGLSRDELHEVLKKEGIYTRKYFSPLTSSFTCYQGMFPIQDTPIAAKAAAEVLTLPLYSELSLEDVDWICGIIIQSRGKKHEIS